MSESKNCCLVCLSIAAARRADNGSAPPHSATVEATRSPPLFEPAFLVAAIDPDLVRGRSVSVRQVLWDRTFADRTGLAQRSRLKDEIESIRAGKMDDLLLEAHEDVELAMPGGEADSGTEETTPKMGSASSGRKTAGSRSTGGRASGRPRRTPTATTEGGDAVVTESVEPDTDLGTTGTATKVKTEEEESRGRQVDGAEQDDDAATAHHDDSDHNNNGDAATAADGEGNGDELEGEGDEQTEGEDETKPKRGRGRRATKSSSTAAASQKGELSLSLAHCSGNGS